MVEDPTWNFNFKRNDRTTWLPTFGKWCGPGWSAGEKTTAPTLTKEQMEVSASYINGRFSPVDALCKAHDIAYSKAYGQPDEKFQILKADVDLEKGLAGLNWSGLTKGEAAYASLMSVAFISKITTVDASGVAVDALKNAAKEFYSLIVNGGNGAVGKSFTDASGNEFSCGKDANGNVVLNCIKTLDTGEKAEGTYNTVTGTSTIKLDANNLVFTTVGISADNDLFGYSLFTTTNTKTGEATHQLLDTDGNPLAGAGNVSANGNVSFNINGRTYVFSNGTYLGEFGKGSETAGVLADGTAGLYSYNLITGVISRSSKTIGGTYVSGFTLVQTSTNGSSWSSAFQFNNTESATFADHAAWEALSNGSVDRSMFENLVNASTSYLIDAGTLSTPTTYAAPDLSPIGAFYESKSPALDKALSIAGKTFRIVNSAGVAVTAAQLTALDLNKDGKLGAAEMSGLFAWSDLNEDGVLNPSGTGGNELVSLYSTLVMAGSTRLRASDYAFYTAGNASYQTVAQSTATAPVNALVAPAAMASNYAALRNNDNHRTISMGTIVDQYISINGGAPVPYKTHYGETQWFDWNASQVKQTNDNTSLVGTEGNDNFSANYYNVSWLPSGGLINFYGGGGNDVVGGSSRNDNLWGGTGNDVLFGYEGDDHLYGEEGNDEVQAGAGNDIVDGGIGDDRLFGQVGNDTLIGGDGNDLMMGFTASNEAKQTLSAGETDNDIMFGGNGNDQMYGGLGDDTMDGGNDNDLVAGDDGNDTLFGGAGDDEVNGGNGNDIMDGGTGADKMFGGAGNDRMWGGDGNDIMMGFTATNDSKQTLAAGETDNDVMYGGAGDDLMLGGLGNDQLWGGIGNDELQGGAGDDTLYGEDGNDRLFGGAGNDIIYGGNGDDLIVGGVASNEAALAAGTADSNFLYGGAGNDTIIGGIGNDYIDGGAGADNMQGGKGDDMYIVNSVNDVILEQKNEGYDTVVASTNYILNANIEELRLVEGYTINGTGNSLNNRIIGNSQDNILDGVTGADTMIGGLGNDTYYVDNVGDQVVELAAEGTDTVNASISYTLGDNVENLNLLDFSKAEKGIADGVNILVYGYPKAYELDYMQGDAVAGYKGTCALTSIANLATQANQALSEAQVVQKAIDNKWTVTDATATDYQRGGSNYVGQQALLNSYGIKNGIIMGYNEQAIANLIKGGRGVIIGINAGKLWGDNAYLDNGSVNHVVTVTGVACDATTGNINGFYIADSGRGLVSDMTRYVSITDFRADANIASAYAIYTVEPIKLWEENINGTGNALDNTLVGNRGNNMLTGGKGNDTLIGGAGNDTYVFGKGDGQDIIVDSDSALGNMDVLQLTDLNQTNLWFKHVGNNLQINVLGSSDQITVKDWYVAGSSGTDNQIERIKTADGLTMYNADVEKLVQAMAAVTPPGAAQTSWTSGQTGNGQVLLTVSH